MKKQNKFTFIDLFAGIGGFHIAMHNLGGKCVFASEMDGNARKTYEHNFKKISPSLFNDKLFNDDIRNMNISDIPNFDVLCAGFPCQPFSQAGFRRGFEDNHNSERGNLFFNIAEILDVKKPKAFFLENVRGLVSHDDGRTFKVIKNILEKELGYSLYFKIVKASDYGLPQLRPRVFLIGFRDEGFMKGFSFPQSKSLKFNMSDVWKGKCSREIGFTIRVGGRGSKIDDRRNWDSYLVDNEIRQLGVEEGKMLQGFPKDFIFPVSNTQAMKQLGNSVAIDAIQEVGSQMIKYLENLNNSNMSKNKMQTTKNKGEWTELLLFVKLLANHKLYLSDKDLNKKVDFFNISKVTTKNLDLDFFIIDKTNINSVNRNSGESKTINIQSILNNDSLNKLTNLIINGKATFNIPEFNIIQDELGFNIVKGGTSSQKSDIVLDISNNQIHKKDEGFGIKSYLGSKPTLLNASGNTNFIFKIKGVNESLINDVNEIQTRTKLKDRLILIEESGGKLIYVGAEKETMEYNLKVSDSHMPKIIGYVLLSFYKERISKITDIVDFIHEEGELNKEIKYGEKKILEIKIKRLLVDIMLGFFAGKKWNGEYLANGTIVMKKSGDYVAFHIIDAISLKDYLFQNIKLDTPSTTRHRFGKMYKEKNGELYFKLNLQLRF